MRKAKICELETSPHPFTRNKIVRLFTCYTRFFDHEWRFENVMSRIKFIVVFIQRRVMVTGNVDTGHCVCCDFTRQFWVAHVLAENKVEWKFDYVFTQQIYIKCAYPSNLLQSHCQFVQLQLGLTLLIEARNGVTMVLENGINVDAPYYSTIINHRNNGCRFEWT